METFFPSIPHCFIRKFEYFKQKLEYFLLEFCPKLQTEKILPRQVDRVVNKIRRRRRRRRSRLLTTSIRQSRRLVAVYNKSVNCNPSTPLLRFVLDYIDLLYNFFLQLTRFWLTQIIAVAELLVFIIRASDSANILTSVHVISANIVLHRVVIPESSGRKCFVMDRAYQRRCIRVQ